MSSTVKIRKRRSFSAIPDDILQDTRMRTETRLVLGWLIGRPDGWEVRVGHVQRTLGLTRPRWVKVRKELEIFGFLLQIRKRDGNGHFVWEHIVTDAPSVPRSTIVSKSNDGQSIDGEPHDIPTGPKHNHLNTPLYPPVQISSACIKKAKERFQGRSIEFLEEEWRVAMLQKSEAPKNPDKAFLGWAAVYVKNHP